MKKIILIVFSLLITVFGYSQKCLSGEYINNKRLNEPLFNAKIIEVINNLKNSEKKFSKPSSTQELPGEEIIVIPVVFNVIHTGEPIGVGKNISLSKIEEQITILNEAYSGQYGGVDTKIRFCLAKQNSVGQTTTGVNRFFGNSSYEIGIMLNKCLLSSVSDRPIKNNIVSGFPSNLFLNIWTADLISCKDDVALGYSSSPFDNVFIDGIVLDYLQVGINVTSDPNDANRSNGSTAVHEIGHWLGLFHIFDDKKNGCLETNCETEGDMICDTDPVPFDGIFNIAANCMGYNCKGELTDVVRNFMDYQNPSRLYCQTKFTAGQKKRMRDIITFYRPSIYTQGFLFDFTACKATSYTGGGGGCDEDITLPVQRISRPNIYQDLSQLPSSKIKFGERLEVNDKWLVTIYNTEAYYVAGTPKPNTKIVNTVLIYKREGCRYALHQMIDIEFSNSKKTTDFGLQLNGDEIIVTSSLKDEVYICRLNVTEDKWGIVQQIKNESATSEVGTSTYTIGRFLFILEKNSNSENIFRVYYKNDVGNYVFHQNISLPGFSLPSSGKHIKSGNFRKRIINFNSSTYTGSFDPLEILMPNYAGGFLMFGLDSNNIWTLITNVKPMGFSDSERILDFDISKNYIYVLTYISPNGYMNDTMYLYSFGITERSNSGFPFAVNLSKQAIITNKEVYSDTKLKVFNDQFALIDNIQFQPMGLFYNSNFGSTNLPNWQIKNNKKITCANPAGDSDDFEVFGNLLFYGYGGSTINIYNISDILSREGYNQANVDDSDFYNKRVNSVPEHYSTSGQKITIGDSNAIEFDNIEKEFLANTSITLKPGVTINKGAYVKFKITDSYGLCNSIVTSKRSNDNLEESEGYLGVIEPENVIKINNKTVLYPNPNSGFFKLSLESNHGKVNYEIYNNVGNLIYKGNTDKSTLDINLPNIPTGVYFISLKGDNYKETIKFIKD